MSKTRASCFIRGSKHLETIKARGRRPSAFICLSVFGVCLMKHEARVFDILHQNLRVETIRYDKIALDERTCALCGNSSSRIEDETHLLLDCQRFLSKLNKKLMIF